MKGLPKSKYKTILIDPPWPVVQHVPYEKMPLSKIITLPIIRLADKDAYVFLWTTNTMMQEAFGVLDAWKLKWVQTITWCKNYGLGRPPYTATEHLLMARKGQPSRPHSSVIHATLANSQGVWLREKQILNWFQTYDKPKHSEKPQQSYDIIETLSPGPYLELFARKPRAQWATWGNEILS